MGLHLTQSVYLNFFSYPLPYSLQLFLKNLIHLRISKSFGPWKLCPRVFWCVPVSLLISTCHFFILSVQILHENCVVSILKTETLLRPICSFCKYREATSIRTTDARPSGPLSEETVNSESSVLERDPRDWGAVISTEESFVLLVGVLLLATHPDKKNDYYEFYQWPRNGSVWKIVSNQLQAHQSWVNEGALLITK